MRKPRNICSIIGGLGGVPLGGIEGINISAGGAPPNVPITTKIEIFQSPVPPAPPSEVPPELGSQISAGQFGTIGIGGFIAQALDDLTPFRFPAPQTGTVPSPVQPGRQPFEVPTLDLGFRPQPSGEVTGEIQTLNTAREFRPNQEVETLDQGFIQTGQGGQSREITTGQQTATGGQQTLETIEQSRQEFQSGHFQDPPGQLDYVAPAPAVTKPCATCSMLNQDPNAKDSYPVEMIFHFKNHASAQRLGGLCEADGECEIA